MAKPELGQKQVCPNCQAKFYDLGRRPAHCPKCGTDFDPEEALKLRNRRGRPAGYAADDSDEDQVKDKKVDGDEDEEEEAVATPEIDQEGHEPILTPDDDDDAPVDPTEAPPVPETSATPQERAAELMAQYDAQKKGYIDVGDVVSDTLASAEPIARAQQTDL